jgi:hypothetical protein
MRRPSTRLHNLSVDVGVDRHRRTEEAGSSYSSAPPSLQQRCRRQENLAADESHSIGRIWLHYRASAASKP